MLGSSPTIQNCVFTDNLGTMAGAIIVQASAPAFIGCTFSDNVSGAGGGSVDVTEGGTPSFIDCRFLHNEGQEGGAFLIESGAHPYLTRCLLARNYGRTSGGALAVTDADVTLSECTVANNNAGSQGGAFWIFGGSADISRTIVAFNNRYPVACADGSATLVCCDVFGNALGDWVSCIAGQQGANGNFSSDPLFCGDGSPLSPYTIDSESLCSADKNPACGQVGALPVRCGPADIADQPGAGGLSLACAAPNPFARETCITYAIPARISGEPIRLRVRDAAGRVVRTLVDGVPSPGVHALQWDGRDEAGRACPGGLHFIELSAPRDRQVQRVVLLR